MKIIDYTTPKKVPLINGTTLTLIGYAFLITYSKNSLPQDTSPTNTIDTFTNTLNVLLGTNPSGTTDYIQVYVSKDCPYDADLTVALKMGVRMALDITPSIPHQLSAVAFSTKDKYGDDMILVYLTTTSLQGHKKPYNTITYYGSPYSIDTDYFNRVLILQ